MADTVRVISANDPVQVAAELLVGAVARASERGPPRLAIAGGSAAAAIGAAREAMGVLWKKVRLTWVDERCVPFEDTRSNRGQAYRAHFLRLDDPPELEVPLFLDGETGDSSVARVESALDEVFNGGLDVLLLGMGEDGHVASIFPDWVPPTPRARVAHIVGSPKPPAERITMTLALLKTASETILVADGDSKHAARARVAQGDPSLIAAQLSGVTLVTSLDSGDSI